MNDLLPWMTIEESAEPTSIRARRVVAPMIIGAFMLLPGTTSGVSSVTPAMFTSIAGFPTAISGCSTNPYSANASAETSTTAAVVRELHKQSGLTWDELARAFGVSRRAVHAWANGSKLNQANAARLSVVSRIIQAVAVGDSEETRAILHAPTSDGESPYQRLIRSFAQPGNRREGFAPWELLSSGDTNGDD